MTGFIEVQEYNTAGERRPVLIAVSAIMSVRESVFYPGPGKTVVVPLTQIEYRGNAGYNTRRTDTAEDYPSFTARLSAISDDLYRR